MSNHHSPKHRPNHTDQAITQGIDDAVRFIGLFLWEFCKVIWLMLKEFAFAIRYGQVPWASCFIACGFLWVIFRNHYDFYLFKWIGWIDIYPIRTSEKLHDIYQWVGISAGFWVWLIYRVFIRRKAEKKFEDMFICAGLKNKQDGTPKFILQRDLDDGTTVLRFTNAKLPIERFKAQKEYIESALGVYVDGIHEDRARHTIDIVYGRKPMRSLWEYNLDWLESIGRDQFFTGCNRSAQFQCDLKETPHLLVAGETSSGKSSFLRQMILTLYTNNPEYQFTLIDLKAGLEFQLFKDLPRVAVVSDANQAVMKLRTLEEELNSRMASLHRQGAKDLNTQGSSETKIGRHILVIDEAAELFLPGLHGGTIKQAGAIVSKIARQGRAAGLHLIIGTQRPDARAIDTQIKSNLPGKICFQMADNASSMVVLGNVRAKNLPSIPGRAIWQKGLDNTEIQTPYLAIDVAEDVLKAYRVKDDKNLISSSQDSNAEEGW